MRKRKSMFEGNLEEKDLKNYVQYLLDTIIERLGTPSHPKLPEIKEHPPKRYVTDALSDLSDGGTLGIGSPYMPPHVLPLPPAGCYQDSDVMGEQITYKTPPKEEE